MKITTPGFKINFLFSCFFLFITVNTNAQNFDVTLLQSIDQHETTFKNNFFKGIAQSVTVFNFVTPASLFGAGIIKQDKRLRQDAVYMVGGFIVSTAVTQGLKKLIKRDRPFVTYPVNLKRDSGGGYSFPSGHTSAAFCTATSLSLIFPKWYVIAPAYLYAATVGYARMYQGVHYPSDVLAGAIVGAGSAWLSVKAEKWMNRNHSHSKTSSPTSL